jgi:hypothetical protein
MSTVYTPNASNNPTSYTVPSDGDNANAASILVGLEAVMDKGAYLGAAVAATYKPLVIATSSTIVTTGGITANTLVTAVQATFPAFTTLSTDIVFATGYVSGSTSAATSGLVAALQTFNGASTSTLYTSPNINNGTTSLTSFPLLYGGSPGAITGLTTLRFQIQCGSTLTISDARIFIAILRAG